MTVVILDEIEDGADDFFEEHDGMDALAICGKDVVVHGRFQFDYSQTYGCAEVHGVGPVSVAHHR